jgi:hypothetical protein
MMRNPTSRGACEPLLRSFLVPRFPVLFLQEYPETTSQRLSSLLWHLVPVCDTMAYNFGSVAAWRGEVSCTSTHPVIVLLLGRASTLSVAARYWYCSLISCKSNSSYEPRRHNEHRPPQTARKPCTTDSSSQAPRTQRRRLMKK